MDTHQKTIVTVTAQYITRQSGTENTVDNIGTCILELITVIPVSVPFLWKGSYSNFIGNVTYVLYAFPYIYANTHIILHEVEYTFYITCDTYIIIPLLLLIILIMHVGVRAIGIICMMTNVISI